MEDLLRFIACYVFLSFSGWIQAGVLVGKHLPKNFDSSESRKSFMIATAVMSILLFTATANY